MTNTRRLFVPLWVAAFMALGAGCNSRSAGTGGDGGTAACDSLDFTACRLQAGCVPDICFNCSCTPTFYGCRAEQDDPYECPALGCASPLCCGEAGDCQGGLDCAPPGTSLGCGMCNPDPGDCATDTDCATGQICEPLLCTCDGERSCTAGCADAEDCSVGSNCLGDPEHPRCEPTPCAVPADCPADFDCAPGVGQCVRRSCTQDLDCDGYCVLGLCYDGLGECRGPVP